MSRLKLCRSGKCLGCRNFLTRTIYQQAPEAKRGTAKEELTKYLAQFWSGSYERVWQNFRKNDNSVQVYRCVYDNKRPLIRIETIYHYNMQEGKCPRFVDAE